jgi:hypothetical protein
MQFVVDPLSVVLPADLPVLATGVRGSQVPRAEGQNVAPWDVTPGHARLKLDGYFLQGKTHEPVILVYPAQAYAEMIPGAFESIHRLDNILGNGGAPIRSEDLPTVPFFSAQPVFSSNIQPISFQNGKGVRFLAEYAQYPASANNQDLFYQFQGLTNDGAYYVIAILPIRHPALPETSDPNAVLPSGAIPYPGMTASSADMLDYYAAVTDLLTTSPQDVFTPRLDQLDMLIQSMLVIDS